MECRLCGNNNCSLLIDIDNFPKAAQFFIDDLKNIVDDEPITLSVQQCNSCGLVQLSNNPVNYYKDVITAASLSENSKIKLIEEWQPIIKKYNLLKTNALEVGSCRGDFLEILNYLDFNAIGIENSIDSCEISKKKNCNVIHGYLEDIVDEISDVYSVIICNNFLEHQPRTSLFIQSIYKLLDKDGIVYISVPNLSYLLNKSCLYEFVADHLVYFTEKTLRFAFEINGFDVLEQYKKNNDNDLVLIARKKILIDLHESKEIVSKIINSLNELQRKVVKEGKTISVWGAGHRALALMSMSDLSQIKNVVDSADFKQNKYTPILHKKIISPEEFIKDPSDVLILMLPGAYESQVIGFLKQNAVKCEVIQFNDEPL